MIPLTCRTNRRKINLFWPKLSFRKVVTFKPCDKIDTDFDISKWFGLAFSPLSWTSQDVNNGFLICTISHIHCILPVQCIAMFDGNTECWMVNGELRFEDLQWKECQRVGEGVSNWFDAQLFATTSSHVFATIVCTFLLQFFALFFTFKYKSWLKYVWCTISAGI